MEDTPNGQFWPRNRDNPRIDAVTQTRRSGSLSWDFRLTVCNRPWTSSSRGSAIKVTHPAWQRLVSVGRPRGSYCAHHVGVAARRRMSVDSRHSCGLVCRGQGYRAGVMLLFSRNKFSGSYFFLTSARRCKLSP